MRLAHALASAGVDSRRHSEVIVRNGAVMVNGEVVRDPAFSVKPEMDLIQYRGKAVHFADPVYFILNKPAGYTVTASDPHVKKTVYDLLPKKFTKGSRQTGGSKVRVFPVGRLDKNSTGLLLFTNQGDMANRLIHPRYHVEKVYEIRLHRAWDPRDGRHLLKGIKTTIGTLKATGFRPISRRRLLVKLIEGKNLHLRRMFGRLDYKVQLLCRVGFGPIQLGSLPPGRSRLLSRPEIAALQKAISII